MDSGQASIGNLAGGRLTIDLAAIVANWRDLAARSRPARCAAVVKADAYGLGADRIVPALAAAGCDDFFVALPAEGIAVRALAPAARVFVLNGVHDESRVAVRDSGLIPILSSAEQLALWTAGGGGDPCAIQIDTGMNRLGLSAGEAMALAGDEEMRDRLNVVHVMSHFACADTPDNPMNRRQIDSFQAVATAFSDIESSLANSAGVLSGGGLGFGMTRPGIALYGGQALSDRPNPMRPVITLEGRIAQIRSARAGETVSYGATQTLARDTRIAVVSVGYADGYPRAGSGSGVPLREAAPVGLCGFIGGHRVPALGRITMDLTCFDVTDVPEAALVDGWIELIGPNMPLDDAARAAGTIGYELLTHLGLRFARRFAPGNTD